MEEVQLWYAAVFHVDVRPIQEIKEKYVDKCITKRYASIYRRE